MSDAPLRHNSTSRILAAWDTFMKTIGRIRGRQKTILTALDRELTERELEEVRKNIQSS